MLRDYAEMDDNVLTKDILLMKKNINKILCAKNLKTISDTDENEDGGTKVPYKLFNINTAF